MEDDEDIVAVFIEKEVQVFDEILCYSERETTVETASRRFCKESTDISPNVTDNLAI